MNRRYLIPAIITTAVVIIIFGVINFINQRDNFSLVKIASVDKLLNVGDKIIYLSNDKIQSTSPKETSKVEVIESNVISESSSANNTKSYFVTNTNNQLKSYIWDIQASTKKEYSLYDGFLWSENEPLFISTVNGKSSLLNGSLQTIYSNLNLNNFIAYGGLILAKNKYDDPDLNNGIYSVVNASNSNFKELDLNNIKEDTKAWTNGRYLMYLDEDNKFNTVSNTGQKNTYDFEIYSNQISSTDNETEYFVAFEGNKAIVKSINLTSGKIKKLKTLDGDKIKNKTGIEINKIDQVSYYNKSVYIVANRQLLEVNI